jgi:hypothetical protein
MLIFFDLRRRRAGHDATGKYIPNNSLQKICFQAVILLDENSDDVLWE